MKLHVVERSGQKKILLTVLVSLMLLQAMFFFYYGISRHYNYLTSINDLGILDQSIWGTLQSKPFLNTIIFSKETIGRIEPVIFLFIPFYLLAPHVVWLILAQAVSIPLVCLPIYFLARRVCQSERAAFFWASACLLSPFMLSAASWDFHPVSLAAPFIALAFLAVEKRQPFALFAACLFVLLSKEHFGLLVAGFGLLWYMRHRDLKTSLFLIIFGLGYFYLIMNVITPIISPTGNHAMMSEELGQLSRYGWLGHSLNEVARTILLNPSGTFQKAFVDLGGWLYLTLLFLPLLFLPLLGCEFLLPGAADLLANLLSANPMPRSIYSYHSVTLIPVFFAAAIYGGRRVGRIFKSAAPERQAFVVLMITFIIGWKLFPFFSLPGSFQFWEPRRVLSFHDENYTKVRNLISSDMSVSVQANIGAHFTQRNEVYLYPNKVGEVDAVILRLDSPTLLTKNRNPHEIGSLGHHLQMDPLSYLESVNELINNNAYGKVVWVDPWLIVFKSEDLSRRPEDLIKKIAILKSTWGVQENNEGVQNN